jgi:hypothetical protein
MKKSERNHRVRCLLKPAVLVVAAFFSCGVNRAQTPWTTPDSNNNITNTNSGNVGIGTSAPADRLHVNNVVRISPFSPNAAGSYLNAGAALRLINGNIYGAQPSSIQFGGMYNPSGTQTDAIYNYIDWSNGSLIIRNNQQTKIQIGAGDEWSRQDIYLNPTGGRVGIGTDNPLAILNLKGIDTAFNPTSIGGGFYGGPFIQTSSGTNNNANALTFGYNSSGSVGSSPSAGIYVQSGASFGSRMFLATTNCFGCGPHTQVTINESGFVGLGITDPVDRLVVRGGSGNGAMEFGNNIFNGGVFANSITSYDRVASSYKDMRLVTDSSNATLVLQSGGKVGIGTANPSALLQLNGVDNQLVLSSGDNKGLEIGTDGTTGTILGYNRGTSAYKNINYNAAQHLFSISGTEKLRIDASGNVGIGTPTPGYKLDVNGNTNVTGNLNITANGTGTGNIVAAGTINAKYQDVAEWVPASEQLTAGTVVVLDSTKSNQVVSSSVSYDTRVAGVVSEQPGLALGEKSENKVLVATTGRVRVRVDASKGRIHIGDLLVTSDIPGVAMKSEPVNLGGVQFHRPGTLIGKALEPLEKGKGEILVLLSLQ